MQHTCRVFLVSVLALALTPACDHSTAPQPTPLPCAYTLSAVALSFGAAGGSSSVLVTTAAGCAWTAGTDHGWISIVRGASGTGNGAVDVQVAANPTTAERTGTLMIAGQVVSVRVDAQDSTPTPPPAPPEPPPPPPPPPQPTCEYSVAPVTVAACMAVPSDLTTTITTAVGCSWTAAAGAPWISMKNESGSGTAAIHFTVSDNWDAPRNGIVMVRWPTATAGQNVQIAQAGCRYAVSVTSISVDADGGARTFDVYQQSDPLECGGPLQDGCVWTAQSTVAWIAIAAPAPQRGDQRVSFVVAPNPSSVPRSGVISVRDKTVTITQAGR